MCGVTVGPQSNILSGSYASQLGTFNHLELFRLV
jgi:hypothetical protein